VANSHSSIVKSGVFYVFVANTAVLVLCILGRSLCLTIVVVGYEGAFDNRGLLNYRFVFFVSVSSDRSVTYSHREGCSLTEYVTR